MPRVCKQEKQEILSKLEESYDEIEKEAKNVLVLMPGSYNYCFGRALDSIPKSIPNVVAVRKKGCDVNHDSFLLGEEYDISTDIIDIMEESIREYKVLNGHSFRNTSTDKIAFNSKVKVQVLDDEIDENLKWVDEEQERAPFLFGQEALNVPRSSKEYQIFWPVVSGALNFEPLSNSHEAMLCVLQYQLEYILKEHLDIDKLQYNQYRVILLVPDFVVRRDIKLYMDLLLTRMGFISVLPVQESVACCLACGLIAACVVDVGHDKTSITCVEEGTSLVRSRITLPFGGRLVSTIFNQMLKTINFPYSEFDPASNIFDYSLLEELKCSLCHLRPDIPLGTVHGFEVKNPNKPCEKYQFKLDTEAMIAPAIVFSEEYFNSLKVPPFCKRFSHPSEYDSEDLFNDSYILSLQFRDTSSKKSKDGNGKSDSAMAIDGEDFEEGSVYSQDDTGTDPKKEDFSDHYGTDLKKEDYSDDNGTDLKKEDYYDDDGTDLKKEDFSDNFEIDPPSSHEEKTNSDETTTDSVKNGIPVIDSIEDSQIQTSQIPQGDVILTLDKAIIESVSTCSAQNLQNSMYGTVLLVGGGLSVGGADAFLQQRLTNLLPQRTKQTRVEVFMNPKDLDSKHVAWKGASILHSFESTQDLWVVKEAYAQHGIRILRERSLFSW